MKFTKEEEAVMLENYNKLSGKEISAMLGRSIDSIRGKAGAMGLCSVRPPVTQVNHHFFSEPNYNNSYWAGFIAADGWVQPKENLLGLSQADIKVIEAFKKESGHSGKIYTRTRNNIILGNSLPSLTTENTINVRSKQIQKDLFEIYGIRERKSSEGLVPPNIANEFAKAYIVGYLDGDGSIFINKKGRVFYNITVHENMAIWMNKITGLNNKYYFRKEGYNVNLVRIGASYGPAIKFFEMMQAEILPHLNFFLNRKWDVARAACNQYYSSR